MNVERIVPINLWVDDLRDPAFASVHIPGCLIRDWHWAMTFAEGVYAMKHAKVEHCSIDFWIDAPFNGMDLLRWMEEHNRWPKQRPTAHSASPWAKKAMEVFIEQHYPKEA